MTHVFGSVAGWLVVGVLVTALYYNLFDWSLSWRERVIIAVSWPALVIIIAFYAFGGLARHPVDFILDIFEGESGCH